MKKSPFPGMDPYLEQAWRDVQHSLCTYARDDLQAQIGEAGLIARVDERLVVEQPDDDDRDIYLDEYQIERITRNIANIRDKISRIRDTEDAGRARLTKSLSDEEKELTDETDPAFVDEPDMPGPNEGAGVINGTIVRVVTGQQLRVDVNFAADHKVVLVVVDSAAEKNVGDSLRVSVVADGNQEDERKKIPRVRAVRFKDYIQISPDVSKTVPHD